MAENAQSALKSRASCDFGVPENDKKSKKTACNDFENFLKGTRYLM
jgi:hypothetical protein